MFTYFNWEQTLCYEYAHVYASCAFVYFDRTEPIDAKELFFPIFNYYSFHTIAIVWLLSINTKHKWIQLQTKAIDFIVVLMFSFSILTKIYRAEENWFFEDFLINSYDFSFIVTIYFTHWNINTMKKLKNKILNLELF